jgi:predicted permease
MNHLGLYFFIFLGGSVGVVLTRIGTVRVDKWKAFWEVAVWIFQVIAH